MHTLYDDPISGNGYKVRLVLAHLNIPYRYEVIDIMREQTRTPAYLRLNPNGKIPCLLLDDGRSLAESNAIIWYLAQNSDLIPADTFAQACMLQWMGFEQYSHEPNVAVARFIMLHTDPDSPRRAEIPACHTGGYQALDVMESHLSTREFFVDDQFSLADVSLYAYTHVADEGGFDLSGYPAISAWLARVAAQRGHITIDQVLTSQDNEQT